MTARLVALVFIWGLKIPHPSQRNVWTPSKGGSPAAQCDCMATMAPSASPLLQHSVLNGKPEI